jgi:predicted transcriptional regulator YheO
MSVRRPGRLPSPRLPPRALADLVDLFCELIVHVATQKAVEKVTLELYNKHYEERKVGSALSQLPLSLPFPS